MMIFLCTCTLKDLFFLYHPLTVALRTLLENDAPDVARFTTHRKQRVRRSAYYDPSVEYSPPRYKPEDEEFADALFMTFDMDGTFV